MKLPALLAALLGLYPTGIAQTPAASCLPEQSFEQFWQAFCDHYAFFPLKQVDWGMLSDMYSVHLPNGLDVPPLPPALHHARRPAAGRRGHTARRSGRKHPARVTAAT